MWESLPITEKQEYQKMILAFASLTEMFSQKSEISGPFINSKYQETVFQRAFHATAEDIGNTSYDASILDEETGQKYLVGIKTFGVGSNEQKIAQFKKDSVIFADVYSQIVKNAKNDDGTWKNKNDINRINNDLYMEIAVKVAEMRNKRIRSSKENLAGFRVTSKDPYVKSVYHVLMTSGKGADPEIFVGEISYNEINVNSIQIEGCTSARNPKNFGFNDGNHRYRFTEADNQLLMDFQNQDIIKESWEVIYAKDAYEVFAGIADSVNAMPQREITESYIFPLFNSRGEVEMFSGLNSFNGITKAGVLQRQNSINKIKVEYQNIINQNTLDECMHIAEDILFDKNKSREEAQKKAGKREEVIKLAETADNEDFTADMNKLLHRPPDEVYIPIPNARQFHKDHPDFFAKDAGKLKQNSHGLALSKEDRSFNLVFEPSGQRILAFINQDYGKAIESRESQAILGQWILRGVFQLDAYEPLTKEKMDEVGINGIKLYRTNQDDDVHLEFIWIDEENEDLSQS